MQYQPAMQTIVSYLDQLRGLAVRVDPKNPERIVRLAFEAAGVPSSTYYRAFHGTDLRSETASKVAAALVDLDGRAIGNDGGKAARATAPAL